MKTYIIPRTTDPSTTAARILSDVFAPAVSVFLMCVLSGIISHPQTWTGLGWGILLGGFCAVIPMAAIQLAVHREYLTDRHVTRREQRWWVFLVCAGSVLSGIVTTLLLNAPALLTWILLTMVAGLALTGAITLIGPKISMHTFCLTALIVLAAMLVSPWWLLSLLVALPLVAFARLKLRHHTVLEIALGVVIALVLMFVARLFMPQLG
ncbi:hypothetical protein [Arthrobacter castelli]|uniref:hypothetical protein n=1 Tax=Arthrobacter castelli TaxID=271431 RepID=UPI00138B0C7A|nr:hypothetical protein [Arthrobacter castelli]